MTTELKQLNGSSEVDLVFAQQRAEIMELRYENQKLQLEKTSRLDDSLFSPALYQHYNKVAVDLSKSGLIPISYKGKPEDIFVAMAMGYQLGFPVEQSLQDIAVINGRPCLWGDGLLSLCLNHPDCQSITEEPIYEGENIVGYECVVIRKGHKAHSKRFTMKDAQQAGLIGRGVWKSYPERMLQMRARSLALRDKFADALRGLRIAEIEKDDSYIFEGEVDNKEKPKSQVEKLKVMLKINDEKVDENENKDEIINNILEEKIEEIKKTMEEKGFDEVRRLKAFDYFNIQKIEDLTLDQAEQFLDIINK